MSMCRSPASRRGGLATPPALVAVDGLNANRKVRGPRVPEFDPCGERAWFP